MRTNQPRRNLHEMIVPIMRRFRRARMVEFAAAVHLTPRTRVLDVGGTPFNWELCPVRPRVTLLNIELPDYEKPPDMTYLQGDGCALDFEDGAFDVVYSNSVIEHVGSLERQRQFAAECARVGRSYYVQTPNRWFPVEPHLVTPFFHFLPRGWQSPLVRNFSLWGLVNRPDRSARAWYEDVRLMTKREVRALFPDARIIAERVFGLAKSYTAVRVALPA